MSEDYTNRGDVLKKLGDFYKQKYSEVKENPFGIKSEHTSEIENEIQDHYQNLGITGLPADLIDDDVQLRKKDLENR